MSFREPDWKALYLIEQKHCDEHHQKALYLERQIREMQDDRRRRRAEKIFNAFMITVVLTIIGGVSTGLYVGFRNTKDRPNAEVILEQQRVEEACTVLFNDFSRKLLK